MKNIKYRIAFLVLFSTLPVAAQQQGDSVFYTDFQQIRTEIMSEFITFREEANREYMSFMKQAWEEFQLFKGTERKLKPKPKTPVFFKPDSEPNMEISVQESQYNEPKVTGRVELKDLPVPSGSVCPAFSISFYGDRLSIKYDNRKFSLPSVRENDIIALWQEFSESDFSETLSDLIKFRDKLSLNDWGYYQLVEKVAFQNPALDDENTRVGFQHFILIQSGFDVRIGRVENRLVLLVPVQEEIFGCSYLRIRNRPYYLFSRHKLDKNVSVHSYNIPVTAQGKYLSLQLKTLPLLSREERLVDLSENPFFKIKGTQNKNLLLFFSDYPQTDLRVYARAATDPLLQSTLMPGLWQQLKGKDTASSLRLLLKFVHYSFNYQTDISQFGRERAFFVEENFYYPGNDCEDRAILFSWLVRNLLKLDVVILDYPDHVATAVAAGENLNGDHFRLNDKKYLVCDPTYIGADIGNSMPAYKKMKARIIRFCE